MKKFLLAGFLALSFGLPACADLKIALIDTGKVFDSFYKTKDTATRIAGKKKIFEKDIHDLLLEYQSSQKEAQNLADAVKASSTPLEIRKSDDKALGEKVKDLQAMEKEISQMRQSRSQEIQDDLLRSHQEISDEMMKVIVAYVAGQGYDLVLDKTSAATGVELSHFPYNSSNVFDLTDEIVKRVNAVPPPAQAPAH